MQFPAPWTLSVRFTVASDMSPRKATKAKTLSLYDTNSVINIADRLTFSRTMLFVAIRTGGARFTRVKDLFRNFS